MLSAIILQYRRRARLVSLTLGLSLVLGAVLSLNSIGIGQAQEATVLQRINAGGGQYTDPTGNVWSADTAFQNGSTFTTTSTSDIQNTTLDPLYRSERYGGGAGNSPLSYAIPVANGTYSVRLHFAEIWHGVGAAGGVGSRVFDVHVEDTLALDNYDVYARAGGALKAATELVETQVTDGVLNIVLTASVDNAKVSAIEVLTSSAQPAPTPGATPSPQSVGAFVEENGQVVIEAENADANISRGGRSWLARADRAGFTGAAAMSSEPDAGAVFDGAYPATSPELRYRVQFSNAGTYHVWLRALTTDTSNNSVHVGIDGQATPSADRISNGNHGTWTWSKETMDGPVATIVVPNPGVHTISIWLREDGFRVDKLLLTTNSAFVPGGAGPAESPRSGGATQTAQVAEISSQFNLIDAEGFFVQQHYVDFFNREPDMTGLGFWVSELASCGRDEQCAEAKRVNVSAAYFLSIEFQKTGYLVYRFYKTSFGRMPRFDEFMADSAIVGDRVVVGAHGWQQQLEMNQTAFAERWAGTQAFRDTFAGKSNAEYVNALYANAGVTPSASERVALIEGLNAGTETRAAVLSKVAENEVLRKQELNRAFVLMQYFGYLRRDPDEAGYKFWLEKLDGFGGDYAAADMVKSFIVSGEYRDRFRRR